MSTWQMFSDAGNTFRWEISFQRLPSEEAQPNGALAKKPPPQAHCLPSMADLLLQGSGRLMEFRQGNIPSFRTGLGKSVAVKQSSICRASAILRDEGDQVLQTGCSTLPKVRDGNLDNAPIFRTGLGKSLGVKHSSISRALAILGDGGEVIRTGLVNVTVHDENGERQQRILLPLDILGGHDSDLTLCSHLHNPIC